MAATTVNISFEKNLLKKISEIAKSEMRTRSELLREAARMYIERKNKWKNIFSFGATIAKQTRIAEREVFYEIKKHRLSK